VCVFVALTFGVLPAWRLSGRSPQGVLKVSARSSTLSPELGRMRAVLVVVECALAVILLAGAGLLLRSFQQLRAVEPGFQLNNRLFVEITMPPATRDRPGATLPPGAV